MKYTTYYILTIGCQMNKSDSERVASYLKSFRLKASKPELADIVVLNTCGVRQSAEDRVYTLSRNFKKKKPDCKLIITGCLARRKDVHKRIGSKVDLFMPINKLPEMMTALKNNKDNLLLLKQEEDSLREKQGEKYLEIKPDYNNKFSAFVPIGNGCDNFCSYCVVPYARGREVYRPYNKIILEVKELLSKGYKEINLIAQNVNSYKSQAKDFADLILAIDKLKGDFWLRFSSSHPKDMSDKLISAISKAKKLVNHLHLAVQSGDDEVLRNMNRKYKAQDYLNLIKKVRKVKPTIAITTDVIVGFPGETKEQFQNTVNLFNKTKFDLAYISRYSPRPFTASYNLKDDVSLAEKKRRERVLTELLSKTAYENNKKYLNYPVKVLVEGKSKDSRYFGKSSSYKYIAFKSTNKDLIGKFVEIKITNIKDFGLEGELVKIYN
ncbi:MAG: tRNA (N6-isopentenyl adenosine(37)-C2)-methylthiotransferase MiaB [Candidatus Pacebacteria bacterium]|nr:tRNA (N6-isopentenyl adenosine(37)-C2)-methylthiotransferase MiaB [Candidatus Paceibacterota bacterium]